MVDRLDEERIETLREWATALSANSREELRAAGRAITILIDEIERLRVDVSLARGPARRPGEGSTRRLQPELVEPVSSQALGASLRERLGAALPSRATHDPDE